MGFAEDLEKYRKTKQKKYDNNFARDLEEYRNSDSYLENKVNELKSVYTKANSSTPKDLIEYRARELAINNALSGYNDYYFAAKGNNELASSMSDYKAKIEAIQQKLGQQKASIENSMYDTFTYSGYMAKNAYDRRQTERVMREPDFQKYSQMGADIENPTYEDATAGFGFGKHYFGAKKVNNPVTFAKDNYEKMTMGGGTSTSDVKYSFMTDAETAVYNYLLAKNGEEEAKKYLERLDWELDRRQKEKNSAAIKKLAEENELAGAAVNIGTGLMGGLASLGTLGQTVADTITGKKRPLNPYSKANQIYDSQAAAREGIVADNGWFGTFATDAALTTGQYLAQLAALGGTGALVSMSAGAGGQTAQEYTLRDATKRQALAGGVVAGTAEYVTEKLQLDKLKKLFGGKIGKEAGESLFKEFIKSALEEGGEEAATDIVNYVADRYIMGDKSEYLQSVNRYMQQGDDRQKAVFHTLLDFGKSTAYDFALGATSGAMLSGGAIASQKALDYAATSEAGKNAQRTSDDYKNISKRINLDESAYDSPEAFQAAKTLAEMSEKMVERQRNKEDISNYDRGIYERALYNYENLQQNKARESATAENTVENNLDTDIKEVVAEKASNFGENGAKAFTANYRADMRMSFYEKAFKAYYESGKAGTTLERTNELFRDKVAPEISDSILMNSYYAGQNDESARVQSVQAEHNVINRMAKLFNVDVEFSETLPQNANGLYNPTTGKIHLSENSDRNLVSVFSHEFTHRMQQTSVEEYSAYKNYVLDYMKNQKKEAYDEIINHWKGRYIEEGIEISDSELEDEIVANATEEFLLDDEAVGRLAKENQTLFERVRGFIEKMLEDIKRLFSEYEPKSKEAALLREQQEVYEKARDLWFIAAQKSTDNVSAELANEGEKYSLKLDDNGKYFVDIESDIISGITDNKQITEYVKEYMKEYFPSILKGNFEIPVTAKSRREFTNSEYSKKLRNKLNDLFIDKMRMAANLDEIINSAHNYGYEEASHARTDSAVGFVRGKVQIRVGNNDYAADVILEDLKNRGLIFYDITNISKTKIKDSYTSVADNKSGKPENAAAFTKDSVAQSNKNSNKNSSKNRYSLKDTQGNSLTQEQQEYFKNSKVRDENGNLIIMYHGTPYGGFTIFKNALNYFTPSKEYVERYHSPSASSIRGRYDPATQEQTYEVYLNIEKPFDINNDTDRKIFIDKYVKGGYAAGINPYISNAEIEKAIAGGIDWTEADNLKEFFEENDYDYDGIVLNEGGDETYGDRGMSYVTFSPEQAKNIDNVHPTKDTDIRYSLKIDHNVDVEQLQRQCEELIEAKHELERQLTVTTEFNPRKEDIRRIANKVLREYSSKMDKAELEDNLTKLFKYIQNNENIDGTEVSSITSGIAYKVLNASEKKNTIMEEMYSNLKNTIRTTDIKISDADKADLDRVGGYNQFRKYNFGKLRLSKDGVSVDVFYQELSSQYPEMFPEDINHPADQLIVISDAMDSIKPTIENPYGANMDEMAYIVSQEIFNEYFDIRRERPTFADASLAELEKAKFEHSRKLHKIKETYILRYQEKIRKQADRLEKYKKEKKELRDYKNRMLLAQQQRYQEKLKANRERYKERDKVFKYKNRIIKDIRDINNWLLKPSENKHVPESLRGYTAKFLESIDFSSSRLNNYGEPTKRTLLWNHLRDEYRKIAEASEDIGNESSVFLEIEPGFDDAFTEFINSVETVRIDDMTGEQLKELSHLVTSMRHTITTANKMIANERFNSVAEVANAFIEESSQSKDKKEHRGAFSYGDKLLNVDMLDSFSFFDELGEAGKSLMEGLRSGFDKKIQHTEEARVYMENLLDDLKINEWTGKKAKTTKFHLAGGELELTPAQIMSLYCLSKQEAARNHILSEKGGIRPAPILARKVIFEKGKLSVGDTYIKKAYQPVKVTETELNQIINSLTDEQKNIADGVSQFFQTTSEWGNEVSMALYGYKKFTEKDYFPIVSDKNYLVSKDGDKSNAMSTLKNLAITKSRIKGANNPIMVEDIFDVYTDQTNKMSSYNAFVLPLSDLQKFYNYKIAGGKTVKQEIERTLGSDMKNYIPRFMEAINGTARDGIGTDLPSRLISNFKSAAVGGNIRVIIQQPTSIVRAAAMIDPKYLVKGLATNNKKGDWDKVKKYAPIAQWKDYGFFELDTGRQMKEILLGTDGIGKVKEMLMSPAGMADTVTWLKIWNAVEAETKDIHPELQGEEFNKAVGKRFSEIIDRTQVVDSVFHRSQIMRSDDLFVKTATSFMSEPTKTYNMLHSAVKEAVENKDKASIKKLGRVSAAFVATSLVNAMVVSLVDMFRRKKEDETYEESYKSALVENIIDNVNPLAMIPFAKDVISIIDGYEVQRMDTVAIKDMLNVAKEWDKFFDGESKYTAGYLITESVKALSSLIGVPVKNVARDMEAIISNTTDVFGNQEDKYKENKRKYSLYSEENVSMYIKDLVEAKFNGNEELAVKIYNDLIAAHVDNATLNEKIETASRQRLKDDERIYQLYKAIQEVDTGRIESIYAELMNDGYKVKWIKNALKQYDNKPEETKTYNEIDGFDSVVSGEIYDISSLYNAYKNNPAEYQKIYDTLVSYGMEESSINSAIRNKYNEEAEKNGEQVYDYEELYKAYASGNTTKYNEIYKGLMQFGATEDTIETKIVGFMNNDLSDAIDKGDTAAANRMIKKLYNEKSKEMSDIRATITRKYKPLYVEAVNSGDTSRAEEIQKTLESLNLYDGEHNSRFYPKHFRSWLKDEEEKKE